MSGFGGDKQQCSLIVSWLLLKQNALAGPCKGTSNVSCKGMYACAPRLAWESAEGCLAKNQHHIRPSQLPPAIPQREQASVFLDFHTFFLFHQHLDLPRFHQKQNK